MLPNGRYPLSVAADYGQKEVIEFLVTKGADVNVSEVCIQCESSVLKLCLYWYGQLVGHQP